MSTQNHAKLLEELKSGFKITINWNKYQTKVSTERGNQYLDFLTDPGFQGVNRFTVLPFENEAQRTSYKRYQLPTREIKSYSVLIDGQKSFDQPVRNNLITQDNIQKISTERGDNYATGFLMDYNYFKSTLCWSKSNATNQFYWKSRTTSNNIFHYWSSKRNSFRFFTRNCKSTLISFFVLI